MRKYLPLIFLAGISARLNAQVSDKSDHPYIVKTIPFNHPLNVDRISSPDTTGLVNYFDFRPQFAPTGGETIFGYTGGGFVYGNNADSINECAQGYVNVGHIPIRVLGALLYFATKQSDAGSSPTSKVVVKAFGVSPNKACNTNGSGVMNLIVPNSPGPNTPHNAPDDATDLLFSNIDTINYKYVAFSSPPTYAGDFAVGVDFSTLAIGDTLGLMSDNQFDASNLDYTFHVYHNTWCVTDQLFSTAGAPNYGTGGFDTDVAIWAVVDTAFCYSQFNTTYDSVINTFNLTVDPYTGSYATSYHWDFGDGTTSNSPNPTHLYSVDSLYNVCLKIYTASGDSCEYCHIIGIDSTGTVIRNGGFSLQVINPGAAGISNTVTDNGFSVAPNPFNSQTTLTFSTQQKNTLVQLTDIVGKVIKSTRFSGKQYTLEKGNLIPGIYFIRTLDQNNIGSYHKIVVQ